MLRVMPLAKVFTVIACLVKPSSNQLLSFSLACRSGSTQKTDSGSKSEMNIAVNLHSHFVFLNCYSMAAIEMFSKYKCMSHVVMI